MTEVSLIDLHKTYGDVAAVRALNLCVGEGELVALLGPSGCGKTTTLRMIAGLLPPSRGDIRFNGRSVLHTPAERRNAVLVFQDGLLFPHLSVQDNIGFGLKMRGVARREIRRRAGAMLELVQLPGLGSRRVQALSGGQRQRVALARALIVEPDVLLLDEPLANLDANLRQEMSQLIRSIQRRLKITTLFVTHDQEEAAMLADRVALMIDGELQQYDDARALYARPASVAVAHFFRNGNLLPGTRCGQSVETSIGTFCIDPAVPQPDGPVLLTARPEDSALVHAPGANIFTATVVDQIFLGTHTSVEVCVGERRWRLQAPADVRLCPGATVHVHLPPGRIWLLPREKSSFQRPAPGDAEQSISSS